jgi:hypothetical protein
MTVLDTETRSNIAQLLAGRCAEEINSNALRLENWRRRLFRDPIDVPDTRDPPKWPCIRASISSATITRLKSKVRA